MRNRRRGSTRLVRKDPPRWKDLPLSEKAAGALKLLYERLGGDEGAITKAVAPHFYPGYGVEFAIPKALEMLSRTSVVAQ